MTVLKVLNRTAKVRLLDYTTCMSDVSSFKLRLQYYFQNIFILFSYYLNLHCRLEILKHNWIRTRPHQFNRITTPHTHSNHIFQRSYGVDCTQSSSEFTSWNSNLTECPITKFGNFMEQNYPEIWRRIAPGFIYIFLNEGNV